MPEAIYRLKPRHLFWHLRAVERDQTPHQAFSEANRRPGGVLPEVEFVTQQFTTDTPLPDLTLMGRSCPVFRTAGVERLRGLLDGYEFIDVPCAQDQLTAPKLPVLTGALDLHASVVDVNEWGSTIRLAAFAPAVTLPPMFEVEEMHGTVFVDDRFADAVRNAELSGLGLEFEWSPSGSDPGPTSMSRLRTRTLTAEIAAQLDDVTLDDMVWEDISYGTDGNLDEMSDAVRAFYATRLFEWEVGNGGLHQFFFNHPTPEVVAAVIEGYRFLGVVPSADLVADLIAPLASQEQEWRESIRDGSIETFMDSYAESLLPEADEQVRLHDVERMALVRSNPALFAM